MARYLLLPLISLLSLICAGCLDDLPPQDCSIVEYTVSGRVVDEGGEAIAGASVHVSSESFYNLSFDFTLTTDADGQFSSETLRSYFCEKVVLEVAAEGYAPATVTHTPPGEGWESELPADLTITLEKSE